MGLENKGDRRTAESPAVGNRQSQSAIGNRNSALTFLFQPLLQCLARDLRLPPGFEPGALVELGRLMRLFVLQLPEAGQTFGRQAALLDGRRDRATRFGSMAAVAEAALFSECVDVVERVGDGARCFPKLQLAHARRIDQ